MRNRSIDNPTFFWPYGVVQLMPTDSKKKRPTTVKKKKRHHRGYHRSFDCDNDLFLKLDRLITKEKQLKEEELTPRKGSATHTTGFNRRHSSPHRSPMRPSPNRTPGRQRRPTVSPVGSKSAKSQSSTQPIKLSPENRIQREENTERQTERKLTVLPVLPPFRPAATATGSNRFRPPSALQHQEPRQGDIKQRDANIEKLLQAKNMNYETMMAEYLRRSGLENETKVFILKGHDDHIRRALVARGWHENSQANSNAYHLRWSPRDLNFDYKSLHATQLYNHFCGNRELTTKSGLNQWLRSQSRYGSNIDDFYPRCFDLSDKEQRKEFAEDYESTAVQAIVHKHANYFRVTPFDRVELNVLCLSHAIVYCQHLIEKDICENQARHEFIQRNEDISQEWAATWKFMMEYSKLTPPFEDVKFDKLASCNRYELEYAWAIPSERLVQEWQDTAEKMQELWPQWRIDTGRNVWVVKPGQSSKGSGIHWVDNMDSILKTVGGNEPRVIQKYVEAPMLIQLAGNYHKFDIRQWVLVSRLEPMKIYVFNSWYFRICSAPYSLDHLDELYRHLTNYSVQKTNFESEEESVMSLTAFLEHFNQEGAASWQQTAVPRIHRLIIETLLAAEDQLDYRSGCFELYGFDIILDQWMHPWLLEVNLSPACKERAEWLTEMLDEMATGLVDILLKPSDESEQPLYSLDLVPQRETKTGLSDWEYLYKGDWLPLETQPKTQLTGLVIKGTRANARKERKIDRDHFQRLATEFIQRRVRIYLAKCRVWHRKREIASTMIQKYIRSSLAKAVVQRVRWLHSICLITRVFRVTTAQAKVKSVKMAHLATLCKKIHKGNTSRIQYASLRRKFLTAQILRRTKILFARKVIAQRRWAMIKIILIARRWRKKYARKDLKIRSIQAIVRGFLGRIKFKAIQKYQMERAVIQCAFIGYNWRKICHNRQDQVRMKLIKEYWKMYTAKSYVLLLKKQKALLKFHRGYRITYGQFALQLLEKQYNSCKSAVPFIQTYVRGSLVRNEFRKLRFRFRRLKVQSALRYYLAVKEFKNRQYAFRRLTIQLSMKGYTTRLIVAEYLRRDKAALAIQSQYRRYRFRRRALLRLKMAELRLARSRRAQQIEKQKISPQKLRWSMPPSPGQNMRIESHHARILQNSSPRNSKNHEGKVRSKKNLWSPERKVRISEPAVKIKHKVVRTVEKLKPKLPPFDFSELVKEEKVTKNYPF